MIIASESSAEAMRRIRHGSISHRHVAAGQRRRADRSSNRSDHTRFGIVTVQNWVQAAPRGVTQHRPTSPDPSAGHGCPGHQGLVGAVPEALRQQPQHGPDHTMPSPGGPVTRTAAAGSSEWVWHPVDLPQGLPRGIPGAELDDARTGSVEGCPALPCGRADAVDEMPHSPSAQDHR
jgi:hypothetical protein